ncbi:MAG: Rieske 2Fe-2S domain-containing protein [Candidatus Thermoplasmatota archaeon]|jgi:Rieske Fe-S protein|nr:Rieske 2Fe-2S domain-containing protein [Candidatus Thermoplasmatota archaeon]
MGRSNVYHWMDGWNYYCILRSVENLTEDKNSEAHQIAPGRRQFLKMVAILGVAAASAGVLRSGLQNIIPPVSSATGGFQSLQLVSTAGIPIKTTDLTVNNPEIVMFNYPLLSDPNFLLRLGDSRNNDKAITSSTVTVPADGSTFKSPAGVGPYSSVVAASAICQHLGCKPPELRYHPPSDSSYPGKVHCDCHGSEYDPFNGFSVVSTPTNKPLPSVVLRYESSSDAYYAVNMVGPTIFGQPSDLSGGTPFPSGTVTTKISTESP